MNLILACRAGRVREAPWLRERSEASVSEQRRSR